MPNTLDLIKKEGVTFNRYYVSYPLCCPSRATLLSGRYAHSNGVISNDAPRGGWDGYKKKAIYRHNLGVWLQDAGYRTIHIGKFLNHYGGEQARDRRPRFRPAGTTGRPTRRTSPSGSTTATCSTVNGGIEGPFGDPNYDETSGKDDPGCPDHPPLLGSCNYPEDVLTQRAVEQIFASAPGGPFYLQLDYNAPHGDPRPPIGPEPAARHYDSAADTTLPRPPDFNEGNISDKPSFIRDAPLPGPAGVRRIRVEYQKSLESLRSVDEGVGKVIEALDQTGELDNTYVVFISDNGFFSASTGWSGRSSSPTAGDPHAAADPGARDQPGSRPSELAANIDLGADDPAAHGGARRPGLRRALAGPVLDRHRRAAPGGRSCSSRSSTRPTSTATAVPDGRGGARTRSPRRSRTTSASASAPTSTSSTRPATASSTTSRRTPTS